VISEHGKQLLKLLFNEGEQVCVSHDGYGYHSIPVENLDYATVELKAPPSSRLKDATIGTSEIRFVAINPISGLRRDDNCTAYRTFMVEMDEGDLGSQMRYVRSTGMPYSVCVYSGGKSLHFAITVDRDFPNYKMYYYYACWILKIMSLADQNTKNPTRSIRMAGAMRETGREQRLIELKQRVKVEELNTWLSKFDSLRPEGFLNKDDEGVRKPDVRLDSGQVPAWVFNILKAGVNENAKFGRNVEWFKIASELGKAGYDEESAVAVLDKYFEPEYDFKRQEWLSTVRSGVRNGMNKI
jgi:hypothetical protein